MPSHRNPLSEHPSLHFKFQQPIRQNLPLVHVKQSAQENWNGGDKTSIQIWPQSGFSLSYWSLYIA